MYQMADRLSLLFEEHFKNIGSYGDRKTADQSKKNR